MSADSEQPIIEQARRWPNRAGVALLNLAHRRNHPKLLRWFAAGFAFMGVTTAFLYLFVGLLGLTVPVGTLLTAEVCTLLRFLVNHYWVFGHRSPTWKQCAQYHVANGGAFLIWWTAANLLTLLGVHYLISGIAAVACSTAVSLLANFLWIWGRRHPNE